MRALHRLWKTTIGRPTFPPPRPVRRSPRVLARTVASRTSLTRPPARPGRYEAVCLECRERGNFKRCYRGSKRLNSATSSNVVSGSVTTASTHITRQPTVEITVVLGGGAKHRPAAVADTGAKVCFAGMALLSSLHIKPALLRRRASLRDITDLPLQCFGS